MSSICTRNIVISLGITMLVATLGSGCSKVSESDSSKVSLPTASMSVEPGICVGAVRKGMTIEQVIEELGQPDHRSTCILEYTRFGFATIASKDGIVRSVMCGDASGLPNSSLVKAFSGRTKEGIGMGSSRADIIKAYGETKDTISPPPGQQNLPGREVLVYKPLGLTFSLANGTVHHMIVDFRTSAE